MAEKENKDNSQFAVLALVAIVAVVGLVVLINGGSNSVPVHVMSGPSLETTSNLGGQAYARPNRAVGGHYVYVGNFTENETVSYPSYGECSYFWDNYDAFHEGGVIGRKTVWVNLTGSINNTGNTSTGYWSNITIKYHDACLSADDMNEYYCDGNMMVKSTGTCSEGCYNETGENSSIIAYCKKTKKWLGPQPHPIKPVIPGNGHYSD